LLSPPTHSSLRADESLKNPTISAVLILTWEIVNKEFSGKSRYSLGR
jgi:hypothetical protein